MQPTPSENKRADALNSIEALAQRRVALEGEMAELERASGAALLDGKQFDGERLDGCRSELAVLDAAEAEAVRRDRASQAAQQAQERAKSTGRRWESLWSATWPPWNGLRAPTER